MESAHTQFDTIIIGAGLAGLNCALNLQDRGFTSLILEAQDAVGGRVRTDNVDGYLLDRGFQVFLTAYPEAARSLDYRPLDLCSFVSGAQIRCNGRFYKLTDPFRDPLSIVPMLASDVVPMSDKLKVAYLRQSVKATPVQELFRREDRKIEDLLENNYAFSEQIVERFFRPFFGGITLDKTLSGSSRMFEFVYKMMAEGSVTVPRLGMQQIALQMAAKKKPINGDGNENSGIRLNTRVKAIDRANMQVELENGETIKARSIVIATDGPEAHKLLPEIDKPGSLPTTCLYFSAPKAPIDEAILILNGDGEGPVNNLAVMTNVSSSYAPPGRALMSLTVLGETGPMDDAHLLSAVDKQMRAWFGAQVDDWQHLKTYRLHHALPDQSPPWLTPPQRNVRLAEGTEAQGDRQKIYVAGDHRDNASINGALASGRRAALAICEDLKLAMV